MNTSVECFDLYKDRDSCGRNTKTKGSLTSFSSYFWTREIIG